MSPQVECIKLDDNIFLKYFPTPPHCSLKPNSHTYRPDVFETQGTIY